MKRSLLTILAPLVLLGTMLAAAPVARGSIIHLHAALLGSNEVPPNVSPATGFSDIDLDTLAETLHLHIAFSGLLGTTTASHIHCCLASPFLSGVNVPVATVPPAFPGFPLGVTSGDFVGDLDLKLLSAFNTPFVTAHGGTAASAAAALIAGIEAGETYLNVHTTSFPGGEIRGFLVPAAVPEPGVLDLLALGLGAGLISLRRKRA